VKESLYKKTLVFSWESAVVFGQPLFARVMSHAEMLAFLSGEYRVSHADFLHDYTKKSF